MLRYQCFWRKVLPRPHAGLERRGSDRWGLPKGESDGPNDSIGLLGDRARLVYHGRYSDGSIATGVEQFLNRSRQRAAIAGVDPLGLYLPPYAYAQMQILEAAVKAVGSLDDAKLADHIHKSTFDTVVGPITFGSRGEWAEPRILFVQYQGIQGGDVNQFKQAGRAVILHPARFRSGELRVPFEPMKH